MYLHLGQNSTISTKSIIGFFDLDTCTIGKISKEYLSSAEKNKKVINVSHDLPKSFVVCEDDGNTKVFITSLASTTLAKRQTSQIF